jgi:hypothetical protein
MRFLGRLLAGFLGLYGSIWIVRVVLGVGPHLIMQELGASPDMQAYVGSSIDYGVGTAAYILISGWVFRQMLKMDPRQVFFPFRRG